MASRRKVALPSASSVGIGQTASFDLATNRRYFFIGLVYKTNAAQATIEADITEIRLLINGKVQRRFSAADLNKINAMNGQAFVAGLIPIHLSEPWRRTLEGEEGLAWGMADVASFKIEVDISGAAVAPTLSGIAEVDNVQIPLGLIVKWRKQTFTATGAQVVTITTLTKNDAYSRLHCFSALVTNALVTLDQLERYNATLALNAALLARQKLVQQANTYSIVFDDDQQVTSAIAMKDLRTGAQLISEFRIDLTFSGAGSCVVLSEAVGYAD